MLVKFCIKAQVAELKSQYINMKLFLAFAILALAFKTSSSSPVDVEVSQHTQVPGLPEEWYSLSEADIEKQLSEFEETERDLRIFIFPTTTTNSKVYDVVDV